MHQAIRKSRIGHYTELVRGITGNSPWRSHGEAQDNWKVTVPMLNTGEDGRVRDERAAENAETNKQVICKAREDMKEIKSPAHESVM